MISPVRKEKWLRTFVALCSFTAAMLIHTGEAVAEEKVIIAAASDLRYAMVEIKADYKRQHPDAILEIIFGSSGILSTQIVNGAPFDLYFSADIAYPHMLKRKGLTASKVLPYALGRIVLWSADLDASKLTLKDLTDTRFRKIAIANPRHAPYGKRAQEALKQMGLWDKLRDKLVFGENISHTMQLVESRAADIGIIALSLALNPNLSRKGAYHLIPDSYHKPLEQGYVVTRRAADNTEAVAFADYVASTQARRILRRSGFVLPGEY